MPNHFTGLIQRAGERCFKNFQNDKFWGEMSMYKQPPEPLHSRKSVLLNFNFRIQYCKSYFEVVVPGNHCNWLQHKKMRDFEAACMNSSSVWVARKLVPDHNFGQPKKSDAGHAASPCTKVLFWPNYNFLYPKWGGEQMHEADTFNGN